MRAAGTHALSAVLRSVERKPSYRDRRTVSLSFFVSTSVPSNLCLTLFTTCCVLSDTHQLSQIARAQQGGVRGRGGQACRLGRGHCHVHGLPCLQVGLTDVIIVSLHL